MVERDALEEALVAHRLRAVGTRLPRRPGGTSASKATRLRAGVWLDFYRWIDDGVRLRPSGWETWRERLNRLGFGLTEPASSSSSSPPRSRRSSEPEPDPDPVAREQRDQRRSGRRVGEASLVAIARAGDMARCGLVALRLGVPHLERDLTDAMHKRSREMEPEGVVTPEARAGGREPERAPGARSEATPDRMVGQRERASRRDAAWLADLRAIVETDRRWSGGRERLVVEIDKIAKHIARARDRRYGPMEKTPSKT